MYNKREKNLGLMCVNILESGELAAMDFISAPEPDTTDFSWPKYIREKKCLQTIYCVPGSVLGIM